MDDPVGADDYRKAHYSRGNNFFAVFGFVRITSATNDHKTTHDDHKKDNEAGGKINIGEKSINEGTSAGVFLSGGRVLEKKFITKIKTSGHGTSIAHLV